MDVDYPRAILAVFAVVVAVALLVAGSTSGAAFGTYNPAWDGTAEFRSLADATDTEREVAQNTSVYRTTSPNGTLAVILSPESSYEESERRAVQQFVREGGTLLVAEDFGPNGNGVLRGVGTQARFDGASLRDERNYENGPALPVASIAGKGSYASGVDSLVLNHGTAIRVHDANGTAVGADETNVTVLAASSEYAYLDRNGNEELDDDETLARSPVVTVEPVGDGRVIAVSDPSVFINTMLERGDNRRFARNLYEGADRVVLDVTHAGEIPPLQAMVLALRGSVPLQLIVGGAMLALLVGWESVVAGSTALGRRFGRGGPSQRPRDPEVVVRGVRERHPEWDPERVERVTQAIMSRQTEGGTDE